MPASGPIRLVHLSDLHVTATPLGWKTSDWFNKRFPGWLNFRLLGRRFRFRRAEDVLAGLVRELRRRPPDRVVFSGDATALGFGSEFARAARLLGVSEPDPLPGLAVPGNHDYYTTGTAASGLFEKYFAPWQAGERIDGAVYPFAQRVAGAWLVGVNSATGNRWTWDAAGGVDAAQLDRLGRLLARLDPGPRILVTHYPICLADGRRERRTHGLRNRDELVRVAATGGVCLWLHGHRHGSYHLPQPGFSPFPAVCAGSATQSGRWSYYDYTLDGFHLRAIRREFTPARETFEDRESFELDLTPRALA